MITANSSSPSSTSVHTNCVEIPEFDYSLPRDGDGCHAYSFNVTPVNAAGNGSSATVSYPPAVVGRAEMPFL